ncbi:MAG: hypothetical protein AAGG75_15635 [Bacteroidota bacterium]
MENPMGNRTYQHFSIRDWGQNNFHFVMLKQVGNDVFFDVVPGSLHPSTGEIVPPSCTGNCIEVLTEQEATARIIPYITETNTEYPLTSQQNNTEYRNGIASTTSSSTQFDASLGYFPKQTSSSGSGRTLLTEYTYPEEVPGEPEMDHIIQQNRLASPVMVKTLESGTTPKLLSTKKTVFTEHNGMYLPHKVQTAKMGENLEDRSVFRTYSNGNAVEVAKPADVSTLYVWGYNDQFPVAKIEHDVTYGQLDASLLADINSTTNETQLLTKLQQLRDLAVLDGALITTYTYKPYIGVSTITDARGDRVTFHYDDLNRLKHVKDMDGNLLTENEYNYRNN